MGWAFRFFLPLLLNVFTPWGIHSTMMDPSYLVTFNTSQGEIASKNQPCRNGVFCEFLIKPANLSGTLYLNLTVLDLNFPYEVINLFAVSAGGLQSVDTLLTTINSTSTTTFSFSPATIPNGLRIDFTASLMGTFDGFLLRYWVSGSSSFHNCPGNCSGNGVCTSGVCQCNSGFQYSDCSNDDLYWLTQFNSICPVSSWKSLPSASYCSWPGVTCMLRVVSINLPNQGIVCSGVFQLPTFVSYVDLSNNYLYSPLVGVYPNLNFLALGNSFLREYPRNLTLSKIIRWIDLSNNQISAPVPVDLSTLAHLAYFNIINNPIQLVTENGWQSFPPGTFHLLGTKIWCPVLQSAAIYQPWNLICTNVSLTSISPNVTNTLATGYIYIATDSTSTKDTLYCAFGNDPSTIQSQAFYYNETHLRCMQPPSLPANSTTHVALKYRDITVSNSMTIDVWDPQCPNNTFLSLFNMSSKNTFWDQIISGNIPQAQGNCLPCPVGGKCVGGLAPPVPLPGYFRSTTQPLVFLSCFYYGSCPGGASDTNSLMTTLTSNNTCAANFTGPRCVYCSPGMKLIGGACLLCNFNEYTKYLQNPNQSNVNEEMDASSSENSNAFFILFLLLLLFVAALGCLLMTRRMHVYSGTGLLIMYLQLLGVLYSYPISWVTPLHSTASTLSTYIVHFDISTVSCDISQSFFYQLFYSLLSPFMLIAILALFFMGSIIYDMVHLRAQRGLWVDRVTKRLDHHVAAFILFLNLSHKSLTRMSLDYFVCDCDPDRCYLRSNPAITCGSSDYNTFAPVVIGTGIIYGLGIPLLFLFIGFKNRGRTHRLSTQRRYGVLFKENRRDAWSFTIYKTIWGLAFVSLSFLTRDETLVIALSQVLLQLNVVLIFLVRPLRFSHNNNVWVFVLETLSILLYVGDVNYNLEEMNTTFTTSWTIINYATAVLAVITVFVCIHGLVFEAFHSTYPVISSAALIKKLFENRCVRWLFPKLLATEEELLRFHSTYALNADVEKEEEVAKGTMDDIPTAYITKYMTD